jgi:hypothetical protein
MESGTPGPWIVAFAFTALAASGCARPPPARPSTAEAERARLARLPTDERSVEARWDGLKVAFHFADGVTTCEATLTHPKVRMFDRGPSRARSGELSASLLRQLPPISIESVAVRDGELDYVDLTSAARPELWFHDVELSLENLTTRLGETRGLPILLTARATVQRSGTLTVWVSADPFGRVLHVAGRAALRGLRTAELFEFLQVTAGLRAPSGTLDLYVEFAIEGNHVTGGLKPILRDVEVRPARHGLLHRLTAFVVDLGMDVFSDRVTRRQAVAGIIPIDGTLSNPSPDLWPAVLSVLRNAFVQGIAAGFSNVPPPPREARP